MPRCHAILHSEGGQSPTLSMELRHTRQIDRADYINVVQDERFLCSIFKEEPRCLLQSPTCIEQSLLTRNLNPHSKIVPALQVVHHQIGKMMGVDDHFAN